MGQGSDKSGETAGPQPESTVIRGRAADEPGIVSAGPPPDAPTRLVAGPPADPAVTPREPVAGPARVFDAERRELARQVLNRLVPARPDVPAAGDLGVVDFLERTLAVSSTLRRLLLDGLTGLELRCAAATGRAFVALDGDAQDAALRDAETALPAFFTALLSHTYRGYYLDPRVHRAIGYQSRPPQPLGYDLPAWDPALLERQRARAPFWRRT